MKYFFYGTGRRKNAVARVRLYTGKGKFIVNGKSLEEYFPSASLRGVVEEPFNVTSTVGNFDVMVSVRGGGISGQAGAIRHGLARALIIADTNNRSSLKKVGFLTRDPRMKERRKYGLKKARKAPQFSKR